MLTAVKQRLERDEEEGFTLIELMVVLLIIAILLAIAIPTFLGARNTANARSSQENLRNALTAEQTNWTNTQSFNTGLGTLEPSLTWKTGALAAADKGAPNVSVTIYTETVTAGPPVSIAVAAGTSTTSDGVMLLGYAKDNNCYAIYQSDNAASDFTAYYETAGASGCSLPTPPTAVPTAGTSAATNNGSGASDGGWSASF
jgi:prepilin-type N-terminal cleavage/methylation domain-containing protein